MSALRENSNQICSVIQVNVKGNPDDLKNWVQNRSSKYVLDLNEDKLISINGISLMTEKKEHW